MIAVLNIQDIYEYSWYSRGSDPHLNEGAEQLSRAQNDLEEVENNQVCEEETREEEIHSCELGFAILCSSWLLTDMTNISGQLIGRELVLITVKI